MTDAFDISKLTIPYIRAFSCTEPTDGCVQKKLLPFLSVVSPTDGWYEISRNGEPPVIVREGECFLVAAGVYHTIVHHLHRPDVPIRPKWIFMQATYMDYVDLTAELRPPLSVSGETAEAFIRQIDTLLACRDDRSLASICQQMEIAMELLRDILALSPPLPVHTLISPLAPALKLVDSHLADTLTLEQLAKTCHMSRTAFSSRFREIMGIPAMSYVLQKRLAKAASLLSDPQITLSDIARRTGFYDEYHLSHMFKKYYLFSPRAYKQTIYPE